MSKWKDKWADILDDSAFGGDEVQTPDLFGTKKTGKAADKIYNVISRDDFTDLYWDIMQHQQRGVFERGYIGAKKNTDWPSYALNSVGYDCFSALFQVEPKVIKKIPRGFKGPATVWEHALDTPELEILRHRTTMNETSAAVAWTTFYPTFIKELKELLRITEPGRGKGGEGGGEGGEKITGGGGSGDDENGDDETDDETGGGDDGTDDAPTKVDGDTVAEAVANACDAANHTLDEFAKAWGNETADWIDLSAQERLDLAEQVINDPKLAEILHIAGRWERVTVQKKQERMEALPHEIVDVEMGRNLSHMLASEGVNLMHPLLKLDWLRRYMESSLLQYRLEGTDTLGRGPVVLCVDCSGSMGGRDEIEAKAFAVATARVARRDNRPTRIVLFSMGTETLDAPDRSDGAKAWCDYMTEVASRFSGGGTDFNAPLNEASEAIEKAEKYRDADIIFITDGYAEVDEKTLERLETAKQEKGFDLHTIFIGYGSCDTLESISDSVHKTNHLDADTGTEVLVEVI